MDKLELLNFYNKWWISEKVPDELYSEFKRDIFYALKINLHHLNSLNRVISLIGLRRTGKTTILYQLINFLLSEKLNPKRILFLNISDPLIANKPEYLEELLNEYQKDILREDFSRLKEPVYIFLDEIQYLPNWELYLKRFIDLKFKTKFVITGSAGVKINKKSKESLVGRIDEYQIWPLSFIEFIKFKEFFLKKRDKNSADIIKPEELKWKIVGYSELSLGFMYFLTRYQSYETLAKRILEKKAEIYSYQNFFNSLLNEYIEKGGFPEIINQESIDLAYRYLNQDVLDRVLTQDIPQITKIRDSQLLQTLLVYCAQKNASYLSYDNLSKETGARIETIRNYFLYLRSSFLVNIINKFKKSEISKLRSKKKIYIADLGLRNSILKLDKKTILSELYKGINAETLAINFLINKRKELFFWQKDNYEVDVVIKDLNFVIPIEVKFRNDIKKEYLKGLIKFNQLYKIRGGIVITESKLDYENNFFYIPLWFFLLFF